MKELRLKLLDNGSVIKKENSVFFDFEHESIKVILDTPLNKDYLRCDLVMADNTKTTVLGKEFLLTNSMLKAGDLYFQVVYQKADKVIKWQIVSVKIEKSLNVVASDASVNTSVAQAILGDLSLFKEEIRDLAATIEQDLIENNKQVENTLGKFIKDSDAKIEEFLENSSLSIDEFTSNSHQALNDFEDEIARVQTNYLDELNAKADKTYVDTQDLLKADKTDTYTKTEVDVSLGLKANKQQEEWITPTLLNGYRWTLGGLKYMKDSLGFVHIEGFVSANANSVPSNTTAFLLPPGYLPEAYRYFVTNVTNTTTGFIRVLNDGNVELIYSGHPTWVGISLIFKAKEI